MAKRKKAMRAPPRPARAARPSDDGGATWPVDIGGGSVVSKPAAPKKRRRKSGKKTGKAAKRRR